MLYAWHDSDMNSITGPDRPLAFTAATSDSVWHFTCGRSGLIEMRRRRHGEDSPNWPKSWPLIPDSQGGPHFKAPPGSINGPVMCLIFIQGERLRLGGKKSDIGHLRLSKARITAAMWRGSRYEARPYRAAAPRILLLLLLLLLLFLLLTLNVYKTPCQTSLRTQKLTLHRFSWKHFKWKTSFQTTKDNILQYIYIHKYIHT